MMGESTSEPISEIHQTHQLMLEIFDSFSTIILYDTNSSLTKSFHLGLIATLVSCILEMPRKVQLTSSFGRKYAIEILVMTLKDQYKYRI